MCLQTKTRCMHADAPPAKKKVALGKGTAVLYRELTAAAEEAADAGPGARAKSLLAPQAVGGLAEDLRYDPCRIIDRYFYVHEKYTQLGTRFECEEYVVSLLVWYW